MNRLPRPPRWAEALLERLLPDYAREAITGDLREEYTEGQLPERGALGARLWYLRQVASFVAWPRQKGPPMRTVLNCLLIFTLASVCWFTLMEFVLRHPGFLLRVLTDVVIVMLCALTLLTRVLHFSTRAERWLWLPACGFFALGAHVFVHNLRAPHFEGYLMLVSLALALDGVLMLLTLGHTSRAQRG